MKCYFPDVNVLVALVHRGNVHHPSALEWFNALTDTTTLAFCRLPQLGFLRLLSQPAVMQKEARTQLEAWEIYDVLTSDPRVTFHTEPDAHSLGREFRALTSTPHRSPQQWTDAYLTAFARVAGLTLVTFDRGLSKLARGDMLLLD